MKPGEPPEMSDQFSKPSPKYAAGLYIHIPFCVKKCRYCDFYSCTDLDLIEPFTAALLQEMHSEDTLLNRSNISNKPANANQFNKVSPECDSLYIGGGTPSVLPVRKMVEIIAAAQAQFGLLPGSEITVEVNPESASPDWLQAVRNAGVNRLNIGVQSFHDDHLARLGRLHSAARARETIEAARQAGFANIGLDIIYGLPGQTKEQLQHDLKQALAFFPEHLSCYMLTYEPGTPLTVDLENGRLEKLSDDRTAAFFRIVSRLLQENGYDHYEISNYAATAATRSRHNLKYWQRTPYLGLGPGAHSYEGTCRWWNQNDLEGYINRLTAGNPPAQGRETLTRRQRMLEALYLGLRLGAGINITDFNREFAVDFTACFAPAIEDETAAGRLAMSADHCALTLEGWLFHEAVTTWFAEYL